MTTTESGIPADTTEEFAGRIAGVIDSASLAILLSLWLFIGEGVRDAFNPRKIYARAK